MTKQIGDITISEEAINKPKLNIESITRIFANYVLNYKASHTSTIIGIFGKWGRGKTFFYNFKRNLVFIHNIFTFFVPKPIV